MFLDSPDGVLPNARTLRAVWWPDHVNRQGLFSLDIVHCRDKRRMDNVQRKYSGDFTRRLSPTFTPTSLFVNEYLVEKNTGVAYFKRYRNFLGRTEEEDEKSQ